MDRGDWQATVHGVAELDMTETTQHACSLLFTDLYLLLFSSVQFSRSIVSDSLQLHELQHTRPPCPSPAPGVYSNSCPASWWCHPAISSSVVPFSSCPQSLPAAESFLMSQLFTCGGQSIGVSALASVLQRTPRTDLLQNGLVGSPCSPKDSQESSPTPQFKSINSSALSFLHSPTLTSIHGHWKNNSLDQMDLCWQSSVSAFEYAIQVGHNFPSKW